MKIYFERIKKLDDKQKVYLTHKIFNYWMNGKINICDKKFYPEDLSIYNSVDVSKVFLICSNIKDDNITDDLFKQFTTLDFYEKLDFMIYLFNDINDIEIVPTYITSSINFKILSNKIMEYKKKEE